jgi:rSAM/selenodomain-associated transferase 2
MISVIIPTLNAERTLTSTLAALVPGVVDGVVRDVVIVDGGSDDETLKIADASGATIVRCAEPGRGTQMRTGAEAAKCDWFLFLHADTVLEPGWQSEVATFVERIETGRRDEAAAAFQFALDDTGFLPRFIESGVKMRCTLFRLPYGDQGLLIPRRLYERIGGFKPITLMEDVDIIHRLGRSRTIILRSRAVTSAVRFHREGYMMRVLRNWACLALYYARFSDRTIARVYAGAAHADGTHR